MFPAINRRWLVVGVAAAIVLSAALPAHATYDKMYRFYNTTGDDNVRVRVFTNAMEVITNQYDGLWNPWGEGSPSYVLSGGVYTTRISYKAPDPYDWAKHVKVGWTTSDHDCRLRDLKWAYPEGGTDPILDPEELGGVGGGGVLVDNGDGTYTWVIENHTGLPIQWHGVQLSVSSVPLSLEDLAQVLEVGLVAKRVEDIDALIEVLREAVVAAGEAKSIPRGWVRSLTHKLDMAVAAKEAGLQAWEPPVMDEERALFLWGRAAQRMHTFIAQISSKGKGKKKRADGDLLAGWVEDAQEIQDQLLALPGIVPLLNLPDDADGDGIPELDPNETVSITVEGAGPGDSLILSGDVIDGEGGIVLEWIEQVTIPLSGDLNPPSLSLLPGGGPIEMASANGLESALQPGPRVIVSASDEVGLFGVHYAVVEEMGREVVAAEVAIGDEIEFELTDFIPAGDLPATLDLGYGETLIAIAEDAAGNTSDPDYIQAGGDDEPPIIGDVLVWDPRIEAWSGGIYYYHPIHVTVSVVDDEPGATWRFVEAGITYEKNDPDDPYDGDGYVGTEDGETVLFLRTMTESGGIYRIPIEAVDSAGQTSPRRTVEVTLRPAAEVPM